MVSIFNQDCFEFIKNTNEKFDLIITDPPYNISKDSGFTNTKIEKYSNHVIDFGEWDYINLDLDLMCSEFYRLLNESGTCIIFYDLWKLSYLKESMEKSGFGIIRLIIWEKSNPVPINTKVNYLSNSREIAILGVKGSNPIFNSKYDNGVYNFPIEHTNRIHPTQKNFKLIEELIKKHSNKNSKIFDPFSGSGTTACVCEKLKRDCISIELDETYYNKSIKRLENIRNMI